MTKAWIAESGEYEQRYTAFAASSPEAALKYIRDQHPEGSYVYVVDVHPEILKDGKVYVEGYTNHYLRGKVHQNPSEGNFFLVEHDFELSQVDFAE